MREPNIDEENRRGFTALRTASLSGHDDIVELITEWLLVMRLQVSDNLYTISSIFFYYVDLLIYFLNNDDIQ